MRARLCAYLARCFNAHLTDDEKRFADDVAAARAAASAFNDALKNLAKWENGNTIWVNYRRGYRDETEFDRPSQFRISKIEASVNQRKSV